MDKILLLGASGSIGSQTINVIKNHPESFELVGVSIGSNTKALTQILDTYKSCKWACVKNEDDYNEFKNKYPNVSFFYGDEGLSLITKEAEYDVFVDALVGFRGLKPLLVAIENRKRIALANKESLVAGGVIVKKALKKYGVSLYPIDSEHSAIFQALQGNDIKNVNKLIITASGGSFRNKTRDELNDVTVEQALNHPNWSMGHRITIDSATMMNKGFEVIEAHFLFDIPYEQIDVLIHYESVVHSMVEYCDSSIMAQIGNADMRVPIQYALSYPNRIKLYETTSLDLAKVATLNFKEVDYERYPLLKFAFEVGKKGGNLGAIMNGADEEAVNLFLNKKIAFLDIEKLIMKACKSLEFIENPTYEDLLASDLKARDFVNKNYKNL